MGKVTLNKKFKTYTGALPPNGHRFYLTNRSPTCPSTVIRTP